MHNSISLPLVLAGLLTTSTAALAFHAPNSGAGVPGEDCSNPLILTLGSTPFDNTTFVDSAFGPCGEVIGADIFYTFTAPADGAYTFDTCGSTFDTEISVHFGSDCSAVCIAFNDDGGPCTPQSTVNVVGALTGDVYLVRAGGWNPALTGTGFVNVTSTPPPPPVPTNDSCATPDAAVLGDTVFDTTPATTSAFNGGGPCPTFIGQDVFFVFTAPSDDTYLFDTCQTGFDTRVSIHIGNDCNATCTGTNDDSCLLQSAVTGDFLAGDLVLVQVGGFVNSAGPGILTISIPAPPPPPPSNNDCSTPLALAGLGAFPFNNEFATTSGFDGGDPTLCMSPANSPVSEFGEAAMDLFWTFTVPCDGDYQFDTLSSPVLNDTRLSVHLGDDCSATCVGSNDDENQAIGNFLSSLTLAGLDSGDSYLVQVGMWNETQVVGDGILTVSRQGGDCPTFSILCDPANDHFFGGSVDLSGSTQGGLLGAGLHLEASGGPPIATLGNYESWGFFIVSTGGSGNSTIDKGTLCLDLPWGRYNLQTSATQSLPQLDSVGRFDAVGDLVNMAGTSSTGTGFDVPLELPFMPGGQMIAPGDTLYFQLWYRDIEAGVGNSSNLSNMLEMGF